MKHYMFQEEKRASPTAEKPWRGKNTAAPVMFVLLRHSSSTFNPASPRAALRLKTLPSSLHMSSNLCAPLPRGKVSAVITAFAGRRRD